MLTEFIVKKMKEARYKILEDNSYFGEIPTLKGVWAGAENLEGCREQLQEVLEEWLLLKIQDGEFIPGFSAKVGKRELVSHA